MFGSPHGSSSSTVLLVVAGGGNSLALTTGGSYLFCFVLTGVFTCSSSNSQSSSFFLRLLWESIYGSMIYLGPCEDRGA